MPHLLGNQGKQGGEAASYKYYVHGGDAAFYVTQYTSRGTKYGMPGKARRGGRIYWN